ncbi:hypothetical protein [Humisphaera borealis]|uniref:Uncharacterized protein n=1 Tax=Humisphaera borealis TaxID=2807512 RepID=A0A7M2WQR3_9BACT|nr:hypothetical protein [Humisphaera borealis]QOV87877.1 hypothetical protein IPV69_16505 [Humisphaera borealis]
MIAGSHIPEIDQDVPSPATAFAYRRRARQIRHRYRDDPAGLHLSLKNLAIQVDSARPAASAKAGLRHVKTRVVPARVIAPAVTFSDQASKDAARENVASAAMVARQTATIASGLQSPVGLVEEFSERVRSQLGEGVLRYDQRKALYREAARLGIDRFEASLIIAAIEHRHGLPAPSMPRNRSRRRSSVLSIVSGVLLLEALLLTIARLYMF